MRLTFDCMGKEDIGFARFQLTNWNFLDGQDDLTGANILLNNGPGSQILAVGKDSDR